MSPHLEPLKQPARPNLAAAGSTKTMVSLEKIDSSLFSNLYESFLIDDDPLSDQQDWRNVFDYAWDHGEGHCGYALLDDGKVVGMLGMVFSQREINGAIKKFCNLHTWWVREDHRGRSLVLLRPLLKLEEYTLTHFTPCDTVRAVTKRLGFKPLSCQLRILLPPGMFGRGRAADQPDLTFDTSEIENVVNQRDRTILVDHLPYRTGNLLFQDGNEYCYLLYTYVIRHRLPYCHIHYVSSKELFVKHELAIRCALLKEHKVRFVALDHRIFADTSFPRSFNFWAPAHALYKSSQVTPPQIDNLYSDIVFLRLTALPDMSHELGQIARRMWPRHKE